MKKKKKNNQQNSVDANVLRMYLMGAANPAHSNKQFSQAADVVDLHLEKEVISKQNIDATNALFLQLEQVERSIDAAVASHKMELRVIHGIGTGKLKSEIHKMLAKHPQVVSFENDHHIRYGWGSTLIKLF
jgi:hypothetical protein